MIIPAPLEARARAVAGPAVRRARREVQWRRCGAALRLDHAAADLYPHEVARHATPLFRQLSGVDDVLQRNKVVNLRIATSRLDGLVLRPGQRLSFWRHVGRPSAVAERWRHSYDVFADAGRTQPFGTGATCAWPVLDLQVHNSTDVTFRLSLGVGESHLRGEWTAAAPVLTRYQVYEAEHVMTNDAPGVFSRHNVIRRRVLNVAGEQIADELVTSNHARLMYQPFLEA